MSHHQVFNSIFGFDFSDENAKEKLLEITKEYPYFNLPYFFALKKGWENRSHTSEEVEKAALHFSNLFLLNKRLTEPDTKPEYFIDDKDEEEGTPLVETNTQPILENVVPENQEHEGDNPLPTAEPLTHAASSALVDPKTSAVLSQENGLETPLSTQEPVIENKSNELVNPHTEEVVTEVAITAKQSFASLTDAKNDLPIFEPLHTTDYFASQGIKISEELKKQGAIPQMKSFTDWLRGMKKLNTSYKSDSERPIDPKVEQLAKTSDEGEDIITETMAEAYLAQGKTEKAREVYQKLSLQNPSKSAYFAALIEKIYQ